MAATVFEAGEIGRRAALDAGVRDVDPEAHRGPGRPSKYTPEVAGVICRATASGLSREEAAKLACIDPAQLYRWLADRRPRFRAFQRSLMQAEGAAEVMVAANLVARSRVSTRAGIFWLRTRHPENWPLPERDRRRRDRAKEPAPEPPPKQVQKLIIIPAERLGPKAEAQIAKQGAERGRGTRGS